MPVAKYEVENLQNALWEGFIQAHEVTNVFVFSFDGTLIHAVINYPASWHDCKVAISSGFYYPRLSDEHTSPGYARLGDSAVLRVGGGLDGKIVRGRKANELSGRASSSNSTSFAAIEQMPDSAMPSERQSAEWGICASKQPLGRLHVNFPANSQKRLRILTLVSHLFNFRARTAGLNQIRSVYADITIEVQPWVSEFLKEMNT